MMKRAGEARIGHELYRDAAHKIDLEERNVYRLSGAVVWRATRMIREGDKAITPRFIRRFHRLAIRDLYSCAGTFREWGVTITGSLHKPPRLGVEGLVEEMCDSSNEKAESGEWEFLDVAAYFLWRLNWIHPFGGGNGRTSRALAYLAICVGLGEIPEGRLSIAEQIDTDRERYQAALEDADSSWKEFSVIDVSKMRSLLDEFLVNQIRSADPLPSNVKGRETPGR